MEIWRQGYDEINWLGARNWPIKICIGFDEVGELTCAGQGERRRKSSSTEEFFSRSSSLASNVSPFSPEHLAWHPRSHGNASIKCR